MSLVETYLQQLQQSQLLQHLATAISDTAQRIWQLQARADSAALAADLADPAYKHTQDRGPSSSSLHQLHLHTLQLCAAAFNMQRQIDAASIRSGSSSHHWHQLLLPVAVPALELSVLTVQHVSTCLELLPAHMTVPPQPLWGAMMFARKVATLTTAHCADKCNCCTGLRQQLMSSPYHLPAMCITLLVGVYGSLGKKEADAWWAANKLTSSSSSSSSSSSNEQQQEQEDRLEGRWESAAWELACSRHDVLPASHYLLLQLADCSSKALLWTATSDNTTAEKDLSVTLRACWLAASRPLTSLLQRGRNSSKIVAVKSAVFLGLPVLLHWAWYYLKDNPREVTENPESVVLQVLAQSAFAFRAVARAAPTRSGYKPQERGQQRRRLRPRQRQRQLLRLLQRQGANVSVQDRSGFFFEVSAYLEVLHDVLMLTQKLLTLLLPVTAAHKQLTQAAGSSSSMGRRQAGSSTSSSRTEGRPQIPFEEAVQVCLEGVLSACAELSADAMTGFAGMQPAQQQQRSSSSRLSWVYCTHSTPALREDAGVWFEHAADLCKALEAYVREAARGLAAGGPSVINEAAAELADALVQLIDPRQSGLRGPLLQAAAAAGAGSREQQQLLGLLRSMVKWAEMMGPQQQGLAEEVRVAVAAAAAKMLLTAHRGRGAAAAGDVIGAEASLEAAAHGGTASPGAAAAASSSSSSIHHTKDSSQPHARSSVDAHSSTQPATHLTTEGVLAHVPWLGLLGCCCLQWSQQLATLPSSSATAAAAAAAQSGVVEYPDGVITELPGYLRSVWGTAVHPVWRGKSLIMLCLQALDTWPRCIIFESSGGETAAATELMRALGAGYSTPVLAAMAAKHQCLVEYQGLSLSEQRNPEEPVPLAGFVQQLFALGEALSSVPHKQCCNNPACRNLLGPSELQLVNGRSNTCSICRSARYCSDVCMKQHWKQHRPVCKALAATAAAAAEGSDPKVTASQL
jgi:hypothetical protein